MRVLTLNTDMRDITVQTPRGRSSTRARRSTACRHRGADRHQLDNAGSVCSGPPPTGVRGSPHGGRQGFDPFSIDVTCIDNGMPLVMMRAADMGRTGYESVAEMNADAELKARVEALRLKAALAMGSAT